MAKQPRSIEPPIERLQAQLADGKRRLVRTDVPLNLAWFLAPSARFDEPPLDEEGELDLDLMLEEAETDPEGDAVREFWEEIEIIEKWLEESGIETPLADWQKSRDAPPAEALFRSLNRRALAMRLWDWYGVPIRLKGRWAVRIWSPADPQQGSPRVASMPIKDFLMAVAYRTASDRSERPPQRKGCSLLIAATVVIGWIACGLLL